MNWHFSYLYLSFALILPIAGYGFFVLMSVAVLRASRSTFERATVVSGKSALGGDWGARLSLQILNNADRYLLAAQTGKFVCGFFIGISSLILYQTTLQREILIHGTFSPSLLEGVYGVSLFFLVTLLTLITVQLAKSIAYHMPERVLISCGWIFWIFGQIFAPVRVLSESVISLTLKVLRIEKPAERELVLSSEDLEEVIEQSAQAGTIDSEESELLQGALRISEVRVSEIMTPRADIVAVPLDTEFDKLLEVFDTAGFSRVLIIGEQLDEVKGMLLAKDLLRYIGKPKVELPSLESMIREVVSVEGERTADEVMRRMRASQAHLAVVLDEHGGVDGLVTLEDLIEEIVGDIFDETDVLEEEEEVVLTRSGDLLVDGGMTLADLNSGYGIDLPEGEYDTVAGFIIDQLGRIPAEGEIVNHNGSKLEVKAVEENRITQLRISDSQ